MVEVWHLVIVALSLGATIIGGCWAIYQYVMGHIARIDNTINAQVARRSEMFESMRVGYQTAHEHVYAKLAETNERIHALRSENIRDFATRHDIDKMDRQIELLNEKMDTVVQIVSGVQAILNNKVITK